MDLDVARATSASEQRRLALAWEAVNEMLDAPLPGDEQNQARLYHGLGLAGDVLLSLAMEAGCGTPKAGRLPISGR